jgi:hypothetical protein
VCKFTGLGCCLFLCLASLLGCEGKGSPQPLIPAPATVISKSEESTDVDGIVDKVFENHQVQKEELRLSANEVKQSLGNNKEWTEFSLEEIAPGQYKGEAITSQKGGVVVEARQTADGLYWRWTNADGRIKSFKAYSKW